MPTEQTRGSAAWPDWLRECGDGIDKPLRVVDDCEVALLKLIQPGHTFYRTTNIQFSTMFGELKSKGVVKKGKNGNWLYDSEVARRIEPERTRLAFAIHSACDIYSFFHATVFLNAISIAKLLRGVRSGLQADDLLVPFLCLRGVFEHIGHLTVTIENMNSISLPKDFEEAIEVRGRVFADLMKRLYPTRVDWIKLFGEGDLSAIREKKEIAYSRKEDEANRKADQTLNGIDMLDKRVQGTRVAYEILCEFAHPNVGTFYTATEKHEPTVDSNDVCWHKKQIGLGVPSGMLATCNELILNLFRQTARVLQHHQTLLADAEVEKLKILQVCQIIVRRLVKKGDVLRLVEN
jgi:hypothetical protein